MPQTKGGFGATTTSMVALLLLFGGVAPCMATEQLAAPQHLRVEGLLEDVAVISEPAPRFSFVHPPVPDGNFGIRQVLYRITVSKVDDDKTTWGSGSVESEDTVVAYSGPALSA